MSLREVQRRKIARQVMKSSWALFRRCLLSFGTCLRICWKTVRFLTPVHHSKARGTSFGNRQQVLRRLLSYDASDITLSFMREPDNIYDTNAVKILASVKYRGSAVVGYLSSDLAAKLAPLLDSGFTIVAILEKVTGKDNVDCCLGLNFRYIILE